MPFLLIDASLVLDEDGEPVEPLRQAELNGEVINELGDGSVLALEYPPGEEDDLPPFDVQFVPERSPEDIGSIEFRVFKDGDEIPEGPIIDDFAPYALSKAQDSFFKPPSYLNVISEDVVDVRIEVNVYPEPNAEGDIIAEDSVTFEIRTDEQMPTDFNTGPSTAATEPEVEVEVSATSGRASGAVAVAAGAGSVGADALARELQPFPVVYIKSFGSDL